MLSVMVIPCSGIICSGLVCSEIICGGICAVGYYAMDSLQGAHVLDPFHTSEYSDCKGNLEYADSEPQYFLICFSPLPFEFGFRVFTLSFTDIEI